MFSNVVVILDTGPLGLITNPRKVGAAYAASVWAIEMMDAGQLLMVPAVADYEIRRELLRAGKEAGVAELDNFNAAVEGRYVPLTDGALKRAAGLWAESRRSGMPTADPRELDCDVLIAAQALDAAIPPDRFVIATVNLGHLARFAPADTWSNIRP